MGLNPKELCKAEDFIALKQRVKEEMARRSRPQSIDPLTSYTGDYSETPEKKKQIKISALNEILSPLNAIINRFSLVKSKDKASSINNLDTVLESHKVFSDTDTPVETDCTGGACSGLCTTGCFGTCKGDCSSACAQNCAEICRATCGDSCSHNSYNDDDEDEDDSCTGSCSDVCQGRTQKEESCPCGNGACSSTCSNSAQCNDNYTCPCSSGCWTGCSASCDDNSGGTACKDTCSVECGTACEESCAIHCGNNCEGTSTKNNPNTGAG